MPPPIPSQQGSRGGLITAVVVFVILWLVSTVFYFQERGLRQQAENNGTAIEARFAGIAPADVTAPPSRPPGRGRGDKYGVDTALGPGRPRAGHARQAGHRPGRRVCRHRPAVR
jgi:hypothetical protein